MKHRKRQLSTYDPKLEAGIKHIRLGQSIRAAAKSINVSWGRLRRYLDRAVSARRVKGRWLLRDHRLRTVRLYTIGQYKEIIVRGFSPSSLVLRYMAAVERFIDTNDLSQLRLFVGKGVKDADVEWHPFETRPNQLYRLHAINREPFEDIYRIVI